MSGTPPLQNCEPIETKLRKKVQGCWRELLRECKERDPNRQGEIPGPDFLGASHSVPLGHLGHLPAQVPSSWWSLGNLRQHLGDKGS